MKVNSELAMGAVICVHFKTGYCKYRERCRKQHIQELCTSSDCSGNCEKRHPKICRFYSLYGSCKFDIKCACVHRQPLQSEIDVLRQELRAVNEKMKYFEDQLKNLEVCKLSETLSENRNSLYEDPAINSCVNLNTLSSSSEVNNDYNSQGILNCTIPQYDGTIDSSVVESNGLILTRTKYCEFCDEDFMNKKDFSDHMQLYNFLCNNCVDYYDEKPWFSLDEFTFTKTGAVRKIPP